MDPSYPMIPCSYEERLHSMLLKEEFSPMMEEIKEAITVMTTAANGKARSEAITLEPNGDIGAPSHPRASCVRIHTPGPVFV